MSENLTKKAAEMLLRGATLLADPCPYCKGVRVIQNGDAFCAACGKGPTRPTGTGASVGGSEDGDDIGDLKKKLELLSVELGRETDGARQMELLKSIRTIADKIEKGE